MSFLQAIQKHVSVLALTVLLFCVIGVLHFVPDASDWSRSSAFLYMPYLLLVLCFVLGACFHQSRISFISLFIIALMLLVSHAAFTKPDDRKLSSIIFLTSVYLPVLLVVFYHMKEQGILSAQGYLKIAIVLSALIVLLLVPTIPSLTTVFDGSGRGTMTRAVGRWLPIPRLGLIMFLCCIPLLLISRSHESPLTGPLLAMAGVFVIMGLSFRSTLWEDGVSRSAFVLLNTGAGVAMVWLVLDSAWRHANIDELTQLPGRRALKMRMDRLGKGFGLAVVDIDHFKKINDKYGHDTGDQVLRYLAAQMRNSGAGHVYRYGGEEFVVVASRVSSMRDFEEDLDALREAVGGRPFGIRGLNRPKQSTKKTKKTRASGSGEKIKVTVSVGVALDGAKYHNPQEVLQAADKALYRAKKAGRNRIKSAR